MNVKRKLLFPSNVNSVATVTVADTGYQRIITVQRSDIITLLSISLLRQEGFILH